MTPVSGHDDDLRSGLEELARSGTPEPRPEFLGALEARLRYGPTPTIAATSAGGRRWLAPAAAAAAVALILGLALAGRDGAGRQQSTAVLLVSAAGDVTVVSPDGTTAPASRGARLADGDQVHTGPTGRATVGDVGLGPNQAAVVHDGVVAPLALPPMSPRPVPPSSEDGGDATPAATSGRQRPSRTTPTTTAAVPEPAASVAPTAPTSVLAERTPGRRPRRAPLTGGVEPRPPEVGMSLRARSCDPATLAWTGYAGGEFAAYLVLRSSSPEDLIYPPPIGSSTRTVAASRDRERTWAIDGVTEPGGAVVHYLVVAVDARGREVARSNPVACQVARQRSTTATWAR